MSVRPVFGRTARAAAVTDGADDWSEPEPDIAVARRDRTIDAHPTLMLLVIEVAESSLRKDRLLKGRIYAQAAVPEYWIVDLQSMSIDVHTEPTPEGYTHVRRPGDGDVLRPNLLPRVEIAVSEIPR